MNRQPMTNRPYSITLAIAVACTVACSQGDKPFAQRVLLISIDTLRADHLGSYGYVRDTSPNIDSLANSSWVFKSAYVPVPRTGPSVAGLLTGEFPQNIDEWSIPNHLDTVAEVLSGIGWQTVAAVDNANLSKSSGYSQGFDVYRETWTESDQEIERTQIITQTAVQYLTTFAETRESFFMWLHYVNPHLPYTPPSGFDAAYMEDIHFDDSIRLPNTSGYVGGIRPDVYLQGEHRLAYYIAQYDGEVLFADEEIGKVLDIVTSEPALSDTRIILTADHGEGLGEQNVYFEHGPYVLDSHVRVPLIVHFPREASNPKEITHPVSTIDIAPTIYAWAGVELPNFSGSRATFPLSGESLIPTRDGQLTNHRQNVFFASLDFWGIRSGNWKMILKTRENTQLGQSHQLFNLVSDKEESTNLYDDESTQAAQLLRRLEARKQIQSNFSSDNMDPANRYQRLDQEALDNLRTLGYLR